MNTQWLSVAICVLCCTVFPRTLDAQIENIQKSRSAYAEGAEAYKAKDYAASRSHFEQALQFRPYHPGLMYTVAALNALDDRPQTALIWLSRIADMGLIYPLEKDSDFDSIKGTAGFRKVLKRLESLHEPIAHSQVAFKLHEKGLVTECVAYDPQRDTFFVSSVHKRKIVVVAGSGKTRDFATAADGLWSVFALRIDAKRRSLWVSSSAMTQMVDFDEKEAGHASILVFDLDSGKLRNRYVLLPDKSEHILGDMILHSSGHVYASDSKANAIYRLSTESRQYVEFVPPGPFASLQGLAFSDDERYLFAADYSQGLFRVDMRTRAETLAGRAVFMNLDSMSIRESHAKPITTTIADILAGVWPEERSCRNQFGSLSPHIQRGLVPPVLSLGSQQAVLQWWDGYVATVRSGSVLNQSDLARDLRMPQPTVHRYVNMLEVMCLLYKLPVYAVNQTKRLIKSPKVYWFDAALAAFLAGLHDETTLVEAREWGSLVETLIYQHLRIWANLQIPKARLYYWRTSTGKEVDFVIEHGRRLLAVEVKAGDQVRHSDLTNLRLFIADYSKLDVKGLLIYAGNKTRRMDENIVAVPWFSLV